MTQQELDNALVKLGLKVPEAERIDLLKAIKYIEEMKAAVRKPRSASVEPLNLPLYSCVFPENA